MKISKVAGRVGIEIAKTDEKNQFVLIKEKKNQYFINMGTDHSVKGMSFSKDELLELAKEIEIFAKSSRP